MAEAGSCLGGVSSGALTQDSNHWWMGRVEIDTSAPFESVKEAVTRFGGSASWKPPQIRQQIPSEAEKPSDVEILAIKEQTANLQKELIVKERETLDVLKELEATKMMVDGLRTKIKEESSEVCQISPKNQESAKIDLDQAKEAAPSPGFILMELKQAKINLTRATGGLVDIRASVESLSRQIEKERAMIDETRSRISSNTLKISELEKELHQTKLMIQFARNDENRGCIYPPDISLELHKLNSEVEQYRRMAEAGEAEVTRMRAEIERMKTTAAKMEEEAKTVANENAAPEEDDLSAEHIRSAMATVEEANRSKEELLQKVEEATVELKTSREALMEALAMAESANQGKLAAEEALRRWRSERHQRRRRLTDDGSKSALRPTLSIGQILSQKLYGSGDFEAMTAASVPSQPKISLGEMLSHRQGPPPPPPAPDQRSASAAAAARKRAILSKRKNFGFAGLSHLLANQSKNKTNTKKKRKKPTPRA